MAKALRSGRMRPRSIRRQGIVLGYASSMAVAFSSQASAQTNPPAATPQVTLQEVVVKAQKRSENLQKVPIAITAVSPKKLEAAGVTSTQDLASVIPGLQVLNIAGSLIPRVRGVGSTYTAAGIESPVATYVDDVYHAFAADINLDVDDVEQAAVLKGPQGTLFGRNATGGVLLITTRGPSFVSKKSIKIDIDNYLTTRSNVFVTGGLTPNVAASLSVSYAHQARPYGTNFNTGDGTHRLDHDAAARGKVHALVGENTTIDLEGDFTDRTGSTASNFRVAPGFTSILPTPQPARAWDSNQSWDPRQSFHGGGESLKISHDLGFATLASISSYREGEIHYLFSAVASANPARNNDVTYQSSQATEELRLVSTSSGRLLWTVGGFFFYNHANVAFDALLYGPYAAAFDLQSITSRQSVYSYSGFAQGTYKVTDTTRITAGYRYTDDEKRFSGLVSGTTPAGIMIPSADVRNAKDGFGDPTWRLAVEQDITQSVLAYVSYNRGIKSGGFNTTSPSNPPFSPERLDAYEAGLKSQFLNDRARLNVGGFYYNYQNIQINALSNSAPFILNAATAKSYGADLDFDAQLTQRVQLNAGLEWLHSRFTHFPNAPSAVQLPSGGTRAIVIDASGRAMPNSPDVTYSVGATYEVPTRIGDLSFDVNDNYNSGFYGESDNILRQPSYHLLNASLSWDSSDGRYYSSLYVHNILNKAVIIQMATAPWGYIVDYSSPPLVFGVSLKIEF